MKTTIDSKFREISGSKALAPFLTCGFPDLPGFINLAQEVCRSGIDILEIGFPFSDPLADGPTIQYSSRLALNNGFNLDKGFSAVSKIAEKSETPLVIMTYVNNIMAMGQKRFLKRCSDSGAAGLVIPDLPFELSGDIKLLCRKLNLDLILLVSPTTSHSRIKTIAASTSGFLYLVSIKGTTGRLNGFPSGTIQYIKKARELSPRPALVGFGISSPRMAAAAARYSDGVIVGSALVDIVKNSSTRKQRSKHVIKFLNSIKKEINIER